MRDGWRLAWGTFTALRVPPPSAVDAGVAGRAMLLAPLTALPATLVWLALGVGARTAVVAHLVAAALALVATAALSRAMHLDGLADTADGLTSGYDRERALTVMRRGDTGPAGAAALALTLLVQAAALAACFDTQAGVALALLALVVSRVAPAVLCRRGVPSARPAGLGATVAGSVPVGSLAGLVAGITVIACTATTFGFGVGAGVAAVVVVATAVLAAAAVARRAVTRFGGVTGDVIGAAIEAALAGALVVAATASALLAR
jgi:adenosylcobinamide-GDP ribazoletransferase